MLLSQDCKLMFRMAAVSGMEQVASILEAVLSPPETSFHLDSFLTELELMKTAEELLEQDSRQFFNAIRRTANFSVSDSISLFAPR